MAFGWFNRETKSFYVARPEHAAGDLIYLHPDRSIARGTKLTVRSDECVLFFREGRYVGRLDAGSVQLDTANIPFLGHLLIDGLTDANHFICELFFVSLNEVSFEIPEASLGKYRDLNSAHVVAISAGMAYTVKVVDPVKLIVELGGQNAQTGKAVRDIFNGRMLSQLRGAVGGRMQNRPALHVVSNVDVAEISSEVRQLGHSEFQPLGIGIGRVYDLMLSLDDVSLALLRDFGKQESQLALQAMGAQLATQDGFQEFNYVQGQRAAMEGLGKGLVTNSGPMFMSGLNLGAPMIGVGGHQGQRAVPRSAPSAPAGGLLPGQSQFVLCTPVGESGPYSARHVALMAISKGQSLTEITIRRSDDPPELAFSADHEPSIVTEFRRRSQPPLSRLPTASGDQAQVLEMATSAAARNGLLGANEYSMLVRMALSMSLAASDQEARDLVERMAGRLSLQIRL